MQTVEYDMTKYKGYIAHESGDPWQDEHGTGEGVVAGKDSPWYGRFFFILCGLSAGGVIWGFVSALQHFNILH